MFAFVLCFECCTHALSLLLQGCVQRVLSWRNRCCGVLPAWRWLHGTDLVTGGQASKAQVSTPWCEGPGILLLGIQGCGSNDTQV